MSPGSWDGKSLFRESESPALVFLPSDRKWPRESKRADKCCFSVEDHVRSVLYIVASILYVDNRIGFFLICAPDQTPAVLTQKNSY